MRASEQQYTNAPEISLSEIKYEMVYEHRFKSDPLKNPPAKAISIVRQGVSNNNHASTTATTNKTVVIEEDEDEEELPQEMCLLPEFEGKPTESTTTDENKQDEGPIEVRPSKVLGS